MKYASDFRNIARDALRGKWAIAVVVGLIAALLGGIGQGDPEVKLNIDMSGANVSFEYAGQTIISTGGGGTYCWKLHLHCAGNDCHGSHLLYFGKYHKDWLRPVQSGTCRSA